VADVGLSCTGSDVRGGDALPGRFVVVAGVEAQPETSPSRNVRNKQYTIWRLSLQNIEILPYGSSCLKEDYMSKIRFIQTEIGYD